MNKIIDGIRLWWAIKMWGRCPVGGAHNYFTTNDLVYGQELNCDKCKGTGWMDYGR